MKRLIAMLGLLLTAVALNTAKADQTHTFAGGTAQIIRQPIVAGFNLIGAVNVPAGTTAYLDTVVNLGLNEFIAEGAEIYTSTSNTGFSANFVKVATAVRMPPYTLEVLYWVPVVGAPENALVISGGTALFLNSPTAGTLFQIGASPAGTTRTLPAAIQTPICANLPEITSESNASSLNLPFFIDGEYGFASFWRFDRASQVWSYVCNYGEGGWYDDLTGFSDIGPSILPGEGLLFDSWSDVPQTWAEAAPIEDPAYYASTGGVIVKITGNLFCPITDVTFSVPASNPRPAGADLIFVRYETAATRAMQEFVRIDGPDFIGQCPILRTTRPEDGVERVGVRRCAIAVLP